MLRNYFKIAFRNMLRQKVHSFLTVAGLAVGLGIFLFIFRFYSWRMNSDNFHKDIDRIFNLTQVFNTQGEGDRHTEYIPSPLAGVVKNDIPEVEDITRFIESERVILKYGDNKFYENNLLFVDTNFLTFFTFSAIEGNPEQMLSKPNSVVMDKSMAVKYFGDEYPIGKVITMANDIELTVTGVVDDNYQYSSSIWFDFLVSMDVYNSMGNQAEDWNKTNYTGFVKLKEGTKAELINSKLNGVLDKYFPKTPESPKRLYLFPTKDNGLYAQHIQKYGGNNSVEFLTILMILGVLILCIVCINFINLATARSTYRSKEVGIRKTVGAMRFQLIMQFLGETILSALISIPLACVVYILFGNLLNAEYGGLLSFSLWDNKSLILVLIITVLVTSFLSGIYPAFILSSLKPVGVLKGYVKPGKGKGRLRKILVVGQIVVSMIFIVITITWIKQTDYIHNADLGYKRNNILLLPIPQEAQTVYPVLKEEIKRNPGVISVTASIGTPGRWGKEGSFVIPEDKTINEAVRSYTYGINYDFMETLAIPLTSGRVFSKNYNDENSFIITQSFAKQTGWNAPVGKNLQVGDKKGVIIGVVKDLYFADMSCKKLPVVFYLEQKGLNSIMIKVSGNDDLTGTKDYIKTVWNKLTPDLPLAITTLDAYFNNSVKDANIISEFIGAVAIIALFYSSVGLLAMVAFSANTRKKEIAVRKVHGASVKEILILLGRDFVKIILYASLVGLPVAYFLTNKMLEPMAARAPISAGVLIIAFIITTSILLGFIAKEIFRAANRQPIETLKCE